MELEERTGLVTMKGNGVVLLGPELRPGDPAPNFSVVDAEFKPVKLSDFKGRPVLISAVPSLDTGVCTTQTRRFNEAAAELPEEVVLLTISEDLPFAQSRFCEVEDIDRVRVLCDHVWSDFGLKYGVLIKGMNLDSRSVWVIDRDERIVYREIVPEISDQPDYAAALDAARRATE